MRYTAIIESSASSSPVTTILGYGNDSKSDLFIYNISINYSYLEFSTPGEITVVGFDYVSPNTGKLTPPFQIQSGDLISIFENNQRIFIGYILSTTYEFLNPGRMLRIQFDSLLSHFTRQNAIQSVQQTGFEFPPVTTSVNTLQPSAQPIVNTDFFSNKITLQGLVNFLMQQSIYQYAKNIYNFEVLYETPDILSPVDFVWYYASTQSTKEEVLRTAVYYWQQIVYQNPDGNLVFTLPSEQDTSSYVITDGDATGNATPTLRTYSITNNQALLTNNVVYSLIYTGFFPPTTNVPKNLIAQSVPDPKYFPRSFNLFNSEYFSQVQLSVNSLSNDIVTNPILLDLISQVDYVIPGNGDKSQPTTTPLLAARVLAEALTGSQIVEVELNRNENNVEIPLGRTFILNNITYFCIRCEISLSIDMDGQNAQNVIKLTGAPIKSITGIWTQGPV